MGLFKKFEDHLVAPKADFVLQLLDSFVVLGDNLEGTLTVTPRETFDAEEVRCELSSLESAQVTRTEYDAAMKQMVTRQVTENRTLYQTKAVCCPATQLVNGVPRTFKVNVNVEDWPTFLADQRAKKLPVFYLGWIADYPSPDNFIGPFYYSGSYFAPRVAYKNATVDALYTKALAETDPAKQLAMYDQIVDIGTNDAVYILEDQPQNLIAHGPNVKGIVYNPTYAGLIYSTIYK